MGSTATIAPEELYSDEHRRDPYPLWERLRHESPLYFDEVSSTWILTRYADVMRVFGDHDTYSNGPYKDSTSQVFGRTILEMEGMEHVQRRSAVAPEFVGRRLETFVPAIERVVSRLIESFRRNGQADLVADFTTWLPIQVIVEMLGFDLTGREDDFHRWYSSMMDGLLPTEAARLRGRAAHAEVCAFVGPIIEQRQTCPGTDLLSKLVHAKTDSAGPLSRREVESFVSLMLVAGGETTDKAIANLWWNLLCDPDLLDDVRRDRSLVDAAFSETMRKEGPVLYEPRLVTTDVEWHGTTVPAGSTVRVCLGSANNDETVFAEPRTFRLARADLHLGKELRGGGPYPDGRAGHLGFGMAKHFCLGYELARREAVIGTAGLLEALPRVRSATSIPPALEMIRSMRAVRSLPVTFDPSRS